MGQPKTQLDLPAILDILTNVGDWDLYPNPKPNSLPNELFLKTEDDDHEAFVDVDDDYIDVVVDGQVIYSGNFKEDERFGRLWTEE